jgi:tRNA-Thr(GGU) m(6)t(6)A37 methyltransferase TsaA
MALTLEPIGFARTPYVELAEAPRQPAAARGVAGTIELVAGRGYEYALEGIETWSHLWVIFWFDRSGPVTKMKVSPPRSGLKLGVFATRAPHRPNPLGLSVVKLVRVEGLVLHIEDVDLVDGTPILDIKPYVPYADALPDASNGWLESPADLGTQWKVTFAPTADEALKWLEVRGQTGLRGRLEAALALGGAPHPYRRIRALPDGTSTIAVKEWRARFRVGERVVVVERITSGYRAKELAEAGPGELAVHRDFVGRFGPGEG